MKATILYTQIAYVLRKYGQNHFPSCVHATYFLWLSMVGSLCIHMSLKAEPLSFTDSVFNAVSAVTETGLGSVEIHRFSLVDQVVLLLLMLVGSQVFTSSIPFFLRRLYARKAARVSMPIHEKELIHRSPISTPMCMQEGNYVRRGLSMPLNIERALIQDTPMCMQEGKHCTRTLSLPPLGSHTLLTQPISLDIINNTALTGGASLHRKEFNKEGLLRTHLLHCEEFMRDGSLPNHQSQTHDFNGRVSPHTSVVIIPSAENGTLGDSIPPEEYTCSGDMEDAAFAAMGWVTICFFGISIMGGFLICQLCILCSPHARAVLEQNHMSMSFFALFSVVSAFGNCGYILLDDNMVPLQRCVPLLLCLCTLMLLGNTLYAPTLRLVISWLHKRSSGHRKQVYGCILNSSERRFTHLFPRKETAWLVGTVVVINAFQMICMLGLDWRSQALKELGAGYKIAVALFQSIAIRTGGMNAVPLSGFSTSTLLVFLVAMYVAPYPIYLTKRENSKECSEALKKAKKSLFIEQFMKFKADGSFLILATFVICIFERDSTNNDPLNFSFLNIIFEVISGYGNVGLTLGYACTLKTLVAPTSVCMDIPCSFSGKWTTGSKLVLILVMLLGNHKGLPQDMDWNNLSLS